MFLEIQILFSLLKAPLAFDNMFKSFIPPPFLQNLASKYINSLSSSISCPLIMIFSWFLALSLIACVFSLLILSPTCLASSSSLVALFRICCLVDESRIISAAKSKSSSFEVNVHLTPFSPPPIALHITQSITIKNKNPDK